MSRPPRALLLAASAASVAAGAALAVLAVCPVRHAAPRAAGFLFVTVLCVGTVLVNLLLGAALQRRAGRRGDRGSASSEALRPSVTFPCRDPSGR
ncbi:hypothetical protein [Kitasatospora sp. NPDC090091]|uniref:hypothetical protein n=1 Tax=Kitasatospora sp. NPDC090091 TaxID=3364081 RepID=UPI00380718FB